MGFRKTHDLATKVGSYTDAQGKEKGRWENVGYVLTGDDGNQMYCLKRTFNPAGAPNPDGRDTVVIAVFDRRDDAGTNSKAGTDWKGREAAARESRPEQRSEPPSEFNDDIPF